MLVYGDHSEVADTGERLDTIAERLAGLRDMPLGIQPHAQLVAALIEAGQLQQGVEDAGGEAPALKRFVHGLAGCVVRSRDTRFAEVGELPDMPALEWRGNVELKLPEGFAFYEVYPEAYADVARKLRLSGPPRVIGIRSIGTTLGAIVAAALRASPAISVRPYGDPFARQVELPPNIVDERSHYVIVDEGPGLSGSSFGSVADWLQEHGVERERIAFITSHSGEPGAHVSDAHRELWRDVQRMAAEFDPALMLRTFAPLEEFRTGTPLERRKFIGHANGERVLLKFGGLGSIGERKLHIARALHAAGFTPEPLGLVHGFIVERWHEDAQPLGPDERPIAEIGRYIGARARLLPVPEGSGASIEELLTMCRRNISLALGDEAAGVVHRYDPTKLEQRVWRVRTDNKLDRGEWLRLSSGRLLKTDAIDHHQAHDLIGCQAVEWDIAGAIVEFGLDEQETACLIVAAGVPVDDDLLAFYRIAYLSFRIGLASFSHASGGGGAAAEPVRYVLELQHLLQRSSAATRQESLVS